MTNWRICPGCDKVFRKEHPMAIWHNKKMFCSRQCREDYIEYLTNTFHPLKGGKDGK